MTTRIGIRELRDSLTSAIRRVRGGERIEITHHGTPVAVISPLPEDRVERLIAAGGATRGAQRARPLNRFPVVGEVTASAALEDDRAER